MDRRALALIATPVLLLALAAPSTAGQEPGQRPAADADTSASLPDKWGSDGPTSRVLTPEVAQATNAARRPGGAALTRRAQTALAPCADDPAFLCGTVPVPLDRREPDGRLVNLHVEVFPHTDPAAEPEGAVFVTCGGPGCAASLFAKYGFAFFVLTDVAQTRDLVFVDQRGVGLSDVIDCPALQAGGPFYRSAAECHDQLGDAADLYSTTDVADDLDDVRAALGYEQVDLFGGSYAGMDMLTYAVRHPERVRSAVLSAPATVVGTDPFYAYAPEAMPGIVAKVCGRSAACAAAHRAPARDFARLLARLRDRPVTGVGIDSSGGSHRMRVTENLVSNSIMYFNGAHFTGPGELAPAAAALRRGDEVPLLRLAADVDPAGGFAEDLREFSWGHNLARTCVDWELPWDKDARADQRVAQYVAAYRAEPRFYGPVSREAWAAPGWLGWQPAPCISSSWEDRPMYPAGTRVEGIPTLVLGGEYDLPVPESVARLATDVLVDSTYVSVTAAGHDPQFWSDCGPELVQRFIRELAVGDTSCADVPAGGWWVPGSFPRRAEDAPAARQVAGPRAAGATRRLATAVAWTVMDSINHNRFVVEDTSAGLRGGTVFWEPVDGGSRRTFDDVRFTEDVAVDGPSIFLGPGAGGELTGDFTVRGPRGRTTAATVVGPFQTFGAEVTVTLGTGGRQMTFTVPAS